MPASRFSIRVRKLVPPDSHHLEAATGWLGLGLCADARAELKAISPRQQNHPDVLEVRWEIFARENNWSDAAQVAGQLVACAPERASGWLYQAYAVRRAPDGGLPQAREVLQTAAKMFPEEPTVFYNLACYACQLEQIDEAVQWLERAVAIGGKEQIKRMALADDDLKPLWPEIRNL